MSLPKSYRRAVFKAQGQPLAIEQAELKLPGAGELLVKVEACGVCFSDMFAQNNIMGGGFPIVPGHEIIGRVAAVGAGVSRWETGDRVGAGWHGGHDNTCRACELGWHQMCDNRVVNGETKDGGYAEYAIVRSEAAARVPEDVEAAKYAPIMCAGTAVFNSIRHMGVGLGETVAVQGLGGLGHLAIQYASKLGYRVVAISRDGRKEKFARELGAHDYIDSSAGDAGQLLQKLGGAKLVIATAPTAAVMTPLLKGLGILGKLLILSVPGEVPIDTATMLTYGTSVQVWPCGHATDSEDTIRFTQRTGIDCMIEKFPLDRANDAFNHMLSGKVRFRSVITME
ncbi:hypothetical protein Hte_002011 [Hypoxylon texense]